jgi:hypothetical protein
MIDLIIYLIIILGLFILLKEIFLETRYLTRRGYELDIKRGLFESNQSYRKRLTESVKNPFTNRQHNIVGGDYDRKGNKT